MVSCKKTSSSFENTSFRKGRGRAATRRSDRPSPPCSPSWPASQSFENSTSCLLIARCSKAPQLEAGRRLTPRRPRSPGAGAATRSPPAPSRCTAPGARSAARAGRSSRPGRRSSAPHAGPPQLLQRLSLLQLRRAWRRLRPLRRRLETMPPCPPWTLPRRPPRARRAVWPTSKLW